MPDGQIQWLKSSFCTLTTWEMTIEKRQAVTASSSPGLTPPVAGTLKRKVSMGKTSDSAPGIVLGS